MGGMRGTEPLRITPFPINKKFSRVLNGLRREDETKGPPYVVHGDMGFRSHVF